MGDCLVSNRAQGRALDLLVSPQCSPGDDKNDDDNDANYENNNEEDDYEDNCNRGSPQAGE